MDACLRSDDGYLYCLAERDGRLLWKHRGGPSDRKVLGNERMISLWPARGGPVVADGTVYYAAGIWPFMGIFLHASTPKPVQSVGPTTAKAHALPSSRTTRRRSPAWR